MRLLILLALGYFLYRALKTWVGNRSAPGLGRDTGPGKGATPVEDVMVQDPRCKVYFPKRDGFPLNHGGQTLYFCSAECRDKFLEAENDPSG